MGLLLLRMLSNTVICQSAFCVILIVYIAKSTRSTRRAQTSLAEADHHSHMPTVKMLSFGGERLTPPPHPPPKKKKKKVFRSLLAPQSGYATAVVVFFLLIYSS